MNDSTIKSALVLAQECTDLFLKHKTLQKEGNWRELKQIPNQCKEIITRLDAEIRRREQEGTSLEAVRSERTRRIQEIVDDVRRMAASLPRSEKQLAMRGAADARKRFVKTSAELLARDRGRKTTRLKRLVAVRRKPLTTLAALLRHPQERKRPMLAVLRPDAANGMLKDARVRCELLALKARFNSRLLAALRGDGEPGETTADQAVLTSYRTDLEQQERIIVDALQRYLRSAPENPDQALLNVRELARELEVLMDGAVEQVGRSWGILQAARERGIKTHKTCSALLKYSEVIRRLFLLRAYCAVLQARRDDPDFLKSEAEAVRALPKRSALPKGERARVQGLSERRRTNEALVELEGFVENLKVEGRRTRALATTFELSVPGEAATVVVRAKHYSLANNGLCDGSYCRVTGRVSNGARGEALILDIDRVPLNELATKSWWERIAAATRHHMRFYRDEMNLSFVPYPL
jgi:hypothetical protein